MGDVPTTAHWLYSFPNCFRKMFLGRGADQWCGRVTPSSVLRTCPQQCPKGLAVWVSEPRAHRTCTQPFEHVHNLLQCIESLIGSLASSLHGNLPSEVWGDVMSFKWGPSDIRPEQCPWKWDPLGALPKLSGLG